MMDHIDFRLDPRIPDEPEDNGRAMMTRIREAQKTQVYEEGRRRGFDEGYEAGYIAGRKQEQEDFFDYFHARYKGDRS